jgi:hypothetical protein
MSCNVFVAELCTFTAPQSSGGQAARHVGADGGPRLASTGLAAEQRGRAARGRCGGYHPQRHRFLESAVGAKGALGIRRGKIFVGDLLAKGSGSYTLASY